MNRLPVSLYCLYLGVAVVVSSQRLSAEDDFRAMFNGRDLTGWVLTNTPAETWRFEDNMLICSGKPIGEIRTEKMYQNFVMELEWRHMVPKGNAGVFVWADDITSCGVPFHRGIEVQVLENAYGNTKSHTTHGDIFPIHGATMTPVNGRGGSRAFPTENRSNPSPEWNHYRIECRDGEISLAVNGKVVTQGKQCVPRKGYICLESEGGVVHYRNVRISELPSSDIAAEHVAIANRGYRSLYTGLNLNGWTTSGSESQWEVHDWVLTHQGDGKTTSRLISKEVFKTPGCVVDVRLKSEESTAVVELGSTQVDLGDSAVRQLLQPQGQWNRVEVGTTGGTPFVLINDKALKPEAFSSIEDGALILHASGSVDFCNIYGRSCERDK